MKLSIKAIRQSVKNGFTPQQHISVQERKQGSDILYFLKLEESRLNDT